MLSVAWILHRLPLGFTVYKPIIFDMATKRSPIDIHTIIMREFVLRSDQITNVAMIINVPTIDDDAAVVDKTLFTTSRAIVVWLGCPGVLASVGSKKLTSNIEFEDMFVDYPRDFYKTETVARFARYPSQDGSSSSSRADPVSQKPSHWYFSVTDWKREECSIPVWSSARGRGQLVGSAVRVIRAIVTSLPVKSGILSSFDRADRCWAVKRAGPSQKV